MASPRWYPAKYAGKCACGASFPETTPSIYDGDAKRTIRCASCPDLTTQERREVERILLAADAKARDAAENARRAAEAPADVREYIRLAGPNLGVAIPMIRAHIGIEADCRRHGIAVDTLVSALPS